MKQLKILNPHTGRNIIVPPACMRLCAQCLNPMPLDYFRWDSEHSVTLMYLCQHKDTGRFKRVVATLDKKGRLS